MRITSAGKIGVGSNNPARFVHLLDAGSSNVVNVRIQQESSNTATDGGALLELVAQGQMAHTVFMVVLKVQEEISLMTTRVTGSVPDF